MGLKSVKVPTFSAQARVRKRAEFRDIQSNGQRVTTSHFVLLLKARSASSNASCARLGITVSRKVGNAVVRNRAKRLVRAAFRETRPLWANDMDLVVIVRRPLEERKLADVVAEWRSATAQIARRTEAARRDAQRSAVTPEKPVG